MKRCATFISLLMLAVATGCDTADNAYWANPQIRVTLADDFGTEVAGKSAVLLQVQLIVRSLGGTDFSPEPITVDNNTTREVAFEVTIPPDSVYAFAVRFTGSGRLVGEGATVQEVTLETTVIDVEVVQANGANPAIALLPSRVRTSTGSGQIDIVVRYYGADRATAGIAAQFDITGPTPRPMTVDGPDLNFQEGRRIDAAWQFAQDVQGVSDLATLTLSRAQAANFCVEAATANVRVVDRIGNVTNATLQGACILVTP